MGTTNRSPPPRTFWAYGYEIAPPLEPERLGSIRTLLEVEQAKAKRLARTWGSSFVVDERVTHILVVCDSPEQDLEINRQIEAQLAKLGAGFSITPAVQLPDGDEQPPTVVRPASTPPPSEPE